MRWMLLGIALGVAAFLGALWLLNNNSDIAYQNVGAGIIAVIGMVILFIFAAIMFIEGFLAQFILMVCGFIGLRNQEERGYCVVTVIVSLLSLVAAVVVAIVVVGMLW